MALVLLSLDGEATAALGLCVSRKNHDKSDLVRIYNLACHGVFSLPQCCWDAESRNSSLRMNALPSSRDMIAHRLSEVKWVPNNSLLC